MPAPSRLRLTVRAGAERSLLVVIVSFVIAVVGTRWFLQATGYPQVGGGELHIAHMLWGGLLLIVAALVLLVVEAPWVWWVASIAVGAGTGLFIDEVGKFITASNNYFYPLAAPLIYGLLLVLVLVFVLLRRRSGADVVGEPARVSAWEERHLPQRRYRRLLVALLLLFGLSWLASTAVFLLLDEATIQQLINAVTQVPGDRVERPTDPFFYWLESAILGASGAFLVVAALLLGRGREDAGVKTGIIGLVVAITAGALVSMYVEQVTAIAGTVLNAGLLGLLLHYRSRFLESAPGTPAGG